MLKSEHPRAIRMDVGKEAVEMGSGGTEGRLKDRVKERRGDGEIRGRLPNWEPGAGRMDYVTQHPHGLRLFLFPSILETFIAGITRKNTISQAVTSTSRNPRDHLETRPQVAQLLGQEFKVSPIQAHVSEAQATCHLQDHQSPHVRKQPPERLLI